MGTSWKRNVMPLCVGFLLAACGQPAFRIYSDRPILSEGEPGPHLRPGLWRVVNKDCVFDDAKPLGAWPDCATAVIVRPGEMLTRLTGDAFSRERFVLADGYPAMLQTISAPEDKEFHFYGVRPVASGGDIVELNRWPALCAPGAEEGAASGDPSGKEPANPAPEPERPALKGFTYDSGQRCPIHTRDQLRAAVIASEGWTKDREQLRWVRASET